MRNTVDTCLFSGVGLKLSGGEAVLLGYVSVVRLVVQIPDVYEGNC